MIIILYQSIGIGITFLFLTIIKKILVRSHKSSFSDFFIGNSGKYSLSRLQAVAWAILIISFQMSVFSMMVWNGHYKIYQPVFSENILWLLGLTLSSYAAVKGVTVYHLTNDKEYKRSSPKTSDLVTGENGLDFSRFQTIIWSVLAIGIFEISCFEYLVELDSQIDSQKLKSVCLEIDKKSLLPDIPDSFLVLMGLSQGAYVGKKLVPEHKLSSLKEKRVNDLESVEKELESDKRLLEELNSLMTDNLTPVVRDQKVFLTQKIEDKKNKREEILKEIEDIKKLTNNG